MYMLGPICITGLVCIQVGPHMYTGQLVAPYVNWVPCVYTGSQFLVIFHYPVCDADPVYIYREAQFISPYSIGYTGVPYMQPFISGF